MDWALILLLSVVAAGQVQPPVSAAPPRDAVARNVAAKPRTATVRGQVTDRETGQPLGRVMVTLISTVWRDQAISSSATIAQTGIVDDPTIRQNEPRNTVTAADGRFEFTHVPSGAYHVSFSSFSRGTHLDLYFGESAPRDPLKPGKRAPPIELRDGEIRDNVDVALWRAFAVEGRVVDDAGEPVANVEVHVSQWENPSTMSMGRPRLTDAACSGSLD